MNPMFFKLLHISGKANKFFILRALFRLGIYNSIKEAKAIAIHTVTQGG